MCNNSFWFTFPMGLLLISTLDLPSKMVTKNFLCFFKVESIITLMALISVFDNPERFSVIQPNGAVFLPRFQRIRCSKLPYHVAGWYIQYFSTSLYILHGSKVFSARICTSSLTFCDEICSCWK